MWSKPYFSCLAKDGYIRAMQELLPRQKLSLGPERNLVSSTLGSSQSGDVFTAGLRNM